MATLQITTPSDREIVFSRVFDAPRGLVFDAWTKPELLRRWFGPPGWSLAVCEVDLRVGGSWRYVMRSEDGAEMGFGGVYQEIVPPEKIVTTEKFDEAWYEGDALDTVTFIEENGKTTCSTTVLYDSKEVRDTVLNSGAAEGYNGNLDRLAELLASL